MAMFARTASPTELYQRGSVYSEAKGSREKCHGRVRGVKLRSKRYGRTQDGEEILRYHFVLLHLSIKLGLEHDLGALLVDPGLREWLRQLRNFT